MTNSHLIPETTADYDDTRLIERPDGFYWQRKADGAEYGPFPTLLEAVRDMQYADVDDDPGGGVEALGAGEAGLGIADWIDEEGEMDVGPLGLDERD